MNNLKENNIQKTLWHIKRHCSNIENNNENEYRKTELFYLKSSIEILTRILNNENPYPNLRRLKESDYYHLNRYIFHPKSSLSLMKKDR